MRHTNFIFSSQEIEVFYKAYHKDTANRYDFSDGLL